MSHRRAGDSRTLAEVRIALRIAAAGLVVAFLAGVLVVAQRRDERTDSDRVAELRSFPALAPAAGSVVFLEGETRECSPREHRRPGLWREVADISVEEAVRTYKPQLDAAGWELVRKPLENGVPGARWSKSARDFEAEVVIAPGHGGYSFRAYVAASSDCP